MKRQDLVNIIMTFVMGLFIGGYAYVVGFAPTTQKVETVIENIGDTLVITGEAYGGCARSGGCQSFNVADNGSYRFSFTPLGTSEPTLLEGTLPLGYQQKIKRAATEQTLLALSQTTQPEMCDSFFDGVDVRYDIVLNGELYRLDSCGTAVQVDSSLWVALRDVWQYLQAGGGA